MAAQFFSSLADNALLIAAIALLAQLATQWATKAVQNAGKIDLGRNFRLNIHSSEKTAPANGVPKTDAKPPATPQMRIILLLSTSSEKHLVS